MWWSAPRVGATRVFVLAYRRFYFAGIDVAGRCAQAIAKPETLRDVSNFSEVKQADASLAHQLEGWAAGAPPAAVSLHFLVPRPARRSQNCHHVRFCNIFAPRQARVASSLGEGFYTIGPSRRGRQLQRLELLSARRIHARCTIATSPRRLPGSSAGKRS